MRVQRVPLKEGAVSKFIDAKHGVAQFHEVIFSSKPKRRTLTIERSLVK